MAKVKSFDREDVREVCAAIDEALKPVAERFGISLKRGHPSFSAEGFNLKVEGAVLGEGGVPRTREVRDFQNLCFGVGFKPEDLGREFEHHTLGQPHQTFRVSGFARYSTRFPILAVRLHDGKTFKFPAEGIRAKLHPSDGRKLVASAFLNVKA